MKDLAGVVFDRTYSMYLSYGLFGTYFSESSVCKNTSRQTQVL
jgi:hypothetical protein